MSLNNKNGATFEMLNNMRLLRIECDSTIIIDKRIFFVHRNILMARMDFFFKIFTTNLKESRDKKIYLNPSVVDPNVFEDILNYIYIYNIDLKSENIFQIYKAANFLCFDDLLNECLNYIRNSLSNDNAAHYWKFAVEYNFDNLAEECEKFIVRNSFSTILRKNLISLLYFEELKMILSFFEQSCKRHDMFYYVIDWIRFNQSIRMAFLHELIGKIDLSCFDKKFLQNVVFQDNIICQDSLSLQMAEDALINNSTIDTLYMFGEARKNALNRSKPTNLQNFFKTIPLENRTNFCTVAIEHSIYICGGLISEKKSKYNEKISTNDLRVYDTKTKRLQVLNPMKYSRQNSAMASYNGYLYVAGGSSMRKCFDTVERYSLQTGIWQEVAPMNAKRNGLELVEMNGYLYAIGGHNGKEKLSTMERYNIDKNLWEPVASMMRAKSFFGSAIFENKIYVSGTEQCEYYIPQDNRWEYMPLPHYDMRYVSFNRRLAVVNNRLYAIGGIGEKLQFTPPSFEYFDFEKNAWIGKTFGSNYAYVGLAVVSCVCSK